MANLAINGFGRIGRCALRVAWKNKAVRIVGINDLGSPEQLAYLLKYDSNYGTWNADIKAEAGAINIDGIKIPVFAEKEPAKLPWAKLQVDVVLECTGAFRTEAAASAHVMAGAKRVVISAPGKDDSIPTYVRAVNCGKVQEEKKAVINNASCTTNCVAPVTAVLEDVFGIEKAIMTTVHGYTASQALVDSVRPDWREGRAAAENMVPTTTGAAVAVTKTLPQLKDRFHGISIRVPLSTVSLSDMVFLLKKNVTVDEVNAALVKASKTPRFKGVLATSSEPLVSSDYVGNPASATVDMQLTQVVDGNLVKVVAWYDNEWGYANRLIEMAVLVA